MIPCYLLGHISMGLAPGKQCKRIQDSHSTANSSLKARKVRTLPAVPEFHFVRQDDFLLGVLHEHDVKLRSLDISLLQLQTSYSNNLNRRAESEAVASIDGGNLKRNRRTFTDSDN